ncbi:bacillithiol system redox-active protein YtxJ [Galbibacter sp.]|uniref:bacillithiol system redox-active protein YtxJ n=1 Tax=Galbibacter sp. TaxID=2918471 RepID=UPI003A9322E5
MAFFKTIFGSKDSISKENFQWTPLDQAEQLDQLVEESKSQYVLIFKHSTRCGISRFSLQNFESEFKPDPSKVSLYFLDILNNRALSNAVASRFDVVHQSPQVLLIRNTNIICAESHGQISAEDLQSLIEGN